MDNLKKMRQVAFDMLRSKGLDVQRDAAAKFRAGQTEEALLLLEGYLTELMGVDLNPGQLTVLKRPVESRLAQFKLLREQGRLRAGLAQSREEKNAEVKNQLRAEELKRKNVEKLMKEFNTLYKEGKYAEAQRVALHASELDPDNSVVTAAITLARMSSRRKEYDDIKARKEGMFLAGMNQAEDPGDAEGVIRNGGIAFNKETWERVGGRKPQFPIHVGPRMGDKEREIERRLSTPVNMSFNNATLRHVLDDLRDANGINIVVDERALQEEGVSLDSPVSIKLQNVSLKSALNLVLRNAHLTYVIQNEVLNITTEGHAKGKLVTKAYQVADLVIPIENTGEKAPPPLAPPAPAAQRAPLPTPVPGAYSLQGGMPAGSPLGPTGTPASPFGGPSGPNAVTVTQRGASNTLEEGLIRLITSSVQPRSWSDMGGPGSIDYFPLTFALVVNQTVEIQEQIEDLLRALRRLQDVEVAIEVRFITISEDFFERVGVNFTLNIINNTHSTLSNEPALTSAVFQQDPRFINQFQPGRFLAGLNPAGQILPLDIPITQQTFGQAVPPFGGYNGVPGFGGLTMGLAFLSDIQVFLFMEAVQGDVRFNVMQAPKLTMFNGQRATLNASDRQLFVTNVSANIQANGQIQFLPQVQDLSMGVNLILQPIVSADRRFVRLNLQPSLTNLITNAVPLFPIVVPIFPVLENGLAGQPIVFTQFIQQPVSTTISVDTTVAVPDGGTVLMGGLKRLSEGRNEYGPPILSKVPYLNRLFKNTAYGREADSLMLMVTPRIIVQEEEEERQTGFRAPQSTSVP
jgi:type II secretory pathway component GspD/PulD (secretin)